MELLEKVTAVRAAAATAVLLVATAVLTVVGVGPSAWLVTMVALRRSYGRHPYARRPDSAHPGEEAQRADHRGCHRVVAQRH